MNLRKALLFFLIVPLLFAYSCGGGSAGSGFSPPGTGTGEPSSISLFPTSFIAQTNGCIDVYAEVRDGNGVPLGNVIVSFTNLSEPFGRVLDKCGGNPVTSGITNSLGRAKVTVFSTTSGFATIQAEINSGLSNVRERKTVFFTSISSLVFTPTLILDVDDGDGIFDEPADFTLFKTINDNTRQLRATVTNGFFLISGSTVTFGADRPFKVGTDPKANCSDGGSVCDVIFPDGNVKVTDGAGEAFATVEVVPTALSSIPSVLNITALADNGAFNMVSLFLEPVGIGTISVSANPQTVDSGGDSAITAMVTTTAGTPAPDGTTVNFTASAGGIDPFAQTTGGIATAKFTAPTTAQTVIITASVGSIHGQTTVTVTAPPPTPVALAISPGAVTVPGGAALPDVVTFTITGGTPPYTTTSSDPTKAFNDNGAGGGTANDGIRNGTEGGVWTGSSIKVTIPAGAAAGAVTLSVIDSIGGTTTATITVTPVTPSPDFTFSCTPTSVNSVTKTSTCTVTAVNGYVGTVSLACSGVPAGDTLALAPSIVVPTGTSTLTYTCGPAHASMVITCTATGTPAGSGPKDQSIVATCP